MSERTHDTKFLAQPENIVAGSYFVDAGDTDDKLLNTIMASIDPASLAAIAAQEVNVADFNMDNLDMNCLTANDFSSPEQTINQQQFQSQHYEERNPYDQVSSMPTNPMDTHAGLQDARYAALARSRQQVQPSSLKFHGPQVPRGFLQQPYAPPPVLQRIQQPHSQMQAPWMQAQLQLQGQVMQHIPQYQIAAQQYIAPQATFQVPAKQQSHLRQPIRVHQTAAQAQLPAFAQAPIQASRTIAAAAPQSMNFTNFAQVQEAAAIRSIPHNYDPPANDDSFPKDAAARSGYIRQLYDAFIDTTQCLDRATVPNFDARWTAIPSDTSPYTPRIIATICHALFSIATNLHTHGPRSLNIYDKGKLKNVYKYRALTFRARIDKICELLRMSKARCGNLVKFDGLEMVVATAPLLIRQTRSNYHFNRERQDNLVAGKKREAGEMEDGDGDGAENEDWQG